MGDEVGIIGEVEEEARLTRLTVFVGDDDAEHARGEGASLAPRRTGTPWLPTKLDFYFVSSKMMSLSR